MAMRPIGEASNGRMLYESPDDIFCGLLDNHAARRTISARELFTRQKVGEPRGGFRLIPVCRDCQPYTTAVTV